MAILCGFDFSESSVRASEVAADIAKRLSVSVVLVHAVDAWPHEAYGERPPEVLAAARSALELRAAVLRKRGVEVDVRVSSEPVEQMVAQVASELSATLVVCGATGRSRLGEKPLGTTADRLAQSSSVPVLVVRAPALFEAWTRGERKLKVAVGLDFGDASMAAWRWAHGLAAVGPIELEGVHVHWPPEEFSRLGLGGVRSYVDLDPEVERVLTRELEAQYPHGQPSPARFRLQPALGRAADNLLAVASGERADLVVVGSRRQNVLTHLWKGSVSRQVVKHARVSTACIPIRGHDVARPGDPAKTVLVATDFSKAGDAAVAYAYGQVARGGRVYLVHVVDWGADASPVTDIFELPPQKQNEKARLEECLRSLVPVRGTLRDVKTTAKILNAPAPAPAIAQAAERFGADLICLGTHSRSGVTKLLLGSVAQAVLEKTQRPVMLIRQPQT